MDITLYNTLTRKEETFRPLKKGAVSMYHCGPTVYDTPHIGNYRTFVMNDLIRRVFEYNGYEVDQAMNVTDVDDKTIKKSQAEGISRAELTEKYEKFFLEGLESLNILKPHHLIKATDYIQAMLELIQVLIDKGTAYKADDGIYFNVSRNSKFIDFFGKLSHYGQLAGFKLRNTVITGLNSEHSRIQNDEYDKENPRDFVVWKFKTPEDGDNSWSAPFGEGRPGWHIECSAMAMKILGETIDIHTGGQDLIFPHHTNEIAQSESATGKPFAHYWMHGAFITMNDEKMAKSKGNIAKLEDLREQAISPLGYRYWLLTAHYRSPANFTVDAVTGAQNALIRLIETVGSYPDGGSVIDSYKQKFLEAINDDLNLPKAVALAWELIKDSKQSDADKRATLLDFDKVFGLRLAEAPKSEPEEIPAEIQALAEAREEARKAKDWEKADAIRKEIADRGFEVSDTPEGIKIRSL